VESDFSGAGVFVANDYLGGIPATDVGIPPQISGNLSGWDMSRVYFYTNINQLFIGIDYFGIAGDADGDGMQDSIVPALAMIGAQDVPDMAGNESLAVQMDLNQDGVFDIVAGVPGGDPAGGMLGCPNFDLNDCFGVYNYVSALPAFSFLSLTGNASSLSSLPSPDTPDIEFRIDGWNTLAGWDNVPPDTCQIYEFDIQIYSGSFLDGGIGEDAIPNQDNALTVSLEVCADCAGDPNGNAQLDECGVCGGDGSSCGDCAGIPNGDTVIDECGICGGDGSTCAVNVPTLSEWGLIAMAGVLGIIGFMAIRRRKAAA